MNWGKDTEQTIMEWKYIVQIPYTLYRTRSSLDSVQCEIKIWLPFIGSAV